MKGRVVDARISVVIPTFNRQDTIVDAIKTALDQTLAPIEVIVVDDCSTDATVERVRAYSDSRVVLISQPKNMGGGAARNAGILAAKGDWVALLDSDDLWRADKLELQSRAIENARDAICYSNLEFFGGDAGRPYWNLRPLRNGEPLADYMIAEGQAVQTSSLYMYKQTAVSILFDERLRRHQDWDFVLRAEREGMHFVYIDLPLVLYRMSDSESVSRNANVSATLDWMDWAGDILTARHRSIIGLDVIVPRIAGRDFWGAAGLILKAIGNGVVEPRRLLRASLELLPPPVTQPLKRVIRKFRRA
ncbi:glycosyltransferase family 2 protein [Brevundimonas sp. SL130]|uniref:glycosyltransferase family 2 protein n=1 Tax=Brevundimonas sp. SL130 TaxID=2995143 RepID=UPI00226CCFD9|nr:glycosyltransferase family 2 protein [Brevundimonas sp. SL130]WAC59871.1 glycosyltransferase family 2 protein [Brevundimonas sp. SL130]